MRDAKATNKNVTTCDKSDVYEPISPFPIFNGCKEWTIDSYWKEVFEQCSQGKLPKGVRINRQNVITIPNGSSVQLKGDSQEVFRTMMHIFRYDLDLRSENDMSKKRMHVEAIKRSLKSAYSGSWKKIKLKNAKLFFLLDFVVRSSKEHSLTKTSSKRLISDIRLGLLFGPITSDDIEYSDGKVNAIKGLSFCKGAYTFKKKVGRINVPRAPSKGANSLQRKVHSKGVSNRGHPVKHDDAPQNLREYMSEYSSSVISFNI